MKSKSGISTIVATVLIILITVATVTIIWVAIIPLIQNNLASTDQFDVRLDIDTASGYTARDDSTNFSSVQVRRGSDDENISQIQIIIICEGNSILFNVPAPAPNQAKTYNLQSNCTPDSISVAPVFGSWNERNIGSISHEINSLPDGSIVIGPGDTYYDEDGTLRSVDCVIDGDCSGGTPYCSAEKCVQCTQAENCDDNDECTEDVCSSSNVCSNPFEIEGVLCGGTGEFCDGSGNCGICSESSPCDEQECKSVICTAGSCVYTNREEGEDCNLGNGVCDALGNCLVPVVSNICLWDVNGGDCSANDDGEGGPCSYGFEGWPANEHSLDVQIDDAISINSITFKIYHTCDDLNTLVWDFKLNGNIIGQGEPDDRDNCLCGASFTFTPLQWPDTTLISDSGLINSYWLVGQPNTITITPSYGDYAQSFFEAEINYNKIVL